MIEHSIELLDWQLEEEVSALIYPIEGYCEPVSVMPDSLNDFKIVEYGRDGFISTYCQCNWPGVDRQFKFTLPTSNNDILWHQELYRVQFKDNGLLDSSPFLPASTMPRQIARTFFIVTTQDVKRLHEVSMTELGAAGLLNAGVEQPISNDGKDPLFNRERWSELYPNLDYREEAIVVITWIQPATKNEYGHWVIADAG